ncbi:hypothetical protein [Alkalimarinus sediminis]|uniref:Uncharacterized protein n=1 Tax=Alkalimarinus sediminis TaxID=1632866 RepID=A0A9E8HHY2_9ALTE|nr:hypothetical protein [Alkalimarinus sediminis]UZW74739.1 hypothetical protein NNL22_17220 [Alkalimarinus sediminis]
MKQLLLIALLTLFAAEVSAGCRFEGEEYPVGTIKGPLICGSDGYWRPK